MASFLARLNYSLASKYILTVNLRIDGSSNFSKEHQWGTFPGVSAAWRMNEENWLKGYRLVEQPENSVQVWDKPVMQATSPVSILIIKFHKAHLHLTEAW